MLKKCSIGGWNDLKKWQPYAARIRTVSSLCVFLRRSCHNTRLMSIEVHSMSTNKSWARPSEFLFVISCSGVLNQSQYTPDRPKQTVKVHLTGYYVELSVPVQQGPGFLANSCYTFSGGLINWPRHVVVSTSRPQKRAGVPNLFWQHRWASEQHRRSWLENFHPLLKSWKSGSVVD